MAVRKQTLKFSSVSSLFLRVSVLKFSLSLFCQSFGESDGQSDGQSVGDLF